MFVADPKKAVGGHVLAHASTVRLSVRKGKGQQRLMKVVQAPNLAEGEASYAIAAGGVTDYKDSERAGGPHPLAQRSHLLQERVHPQCRRGLRGLAGRRPTPAALPSAAGRGAQCRS